MPVQFTCSHCHKVLSTATRKVGQYIQCPLCNAEVMVSAFDPGATPTGGRKTLADFSPDATTEDHRESSGWGTAISAFVILLAGIGLFYLLNLQAAIGDKPPEEVVATWTDFQKMAAVPKPPPPPEPVKPAEVSSGQPVQERQNEPLAPPDVSTIFPDFDPPPESPPVAAKQPESTPPPASEPPARPEKPASAAPGKVVMKRLHPERSDEDLRKTLIKAPELALKPQTAHALLLVAANPPNDPTLFGDNTNNNKKNTKAPAKKHEDPELETGILLMRKLQPELALLPMRQGLECRLAKEPSENLHVLSRKLRSLLEKAIPPGGMDVRPDPKKLRELLTSDQPVTLDDLLTRAGLGFNLGAGGFDRQVKGEDWLQADAIPTLLQLLQAESKPTRLLLVELLAKINGRSATVALARRAMFDLAPEVREAAVTALSKRPADDYRQELLEGLRYPWPPAADHAAEALVALGDTEAVPTLVRLLKEADPVAAMDSGSGKGGQPVVREIVKVNHLANCLMCHGPSTNVTDLVRGRIPIPGQALPTPSTSPQYYEGTTGVFVRADVTYLKQDFSVVQPVLKPGLWPSNQRYDYLVRSRPATPKEKAELTKRSDPEEAKDADYPQRDAALFALRELTGKNLGTATRDWEPLLRTRRE